MIHASPLPPIQIPDVPLSTLVLDHAPALGDKPALIDGPTGRVSNTGDPRTTIVPDNSPSARTALRSVASRSPRLPPSATSRSRKLRKFSTFIRDKYMAPPT